jgi:biopolymer transport protein ExbB/TolQ
MNLTDQLFRIANLGADWVLWVLLSLSVVSIAIIAERLFFISRRRVDSGHLQRRLADLVDRGDMRAATIEFGRIRAMEAQVVHAGLARAELGPISVTELMNAALSGQRIQYERFLPFLATVGSNAPFIGLFGTVLGIIQAFARFDLTGGASASAGIMRAISEALIATGVGLLVAIPAVIAFNVFKARINRAVASTDQLARTLIAFLSAKAPTQSRGE